jgi:RHS repeat-associated protein
LKRSDIAATAPDATPLAYLADDAIYQVHVDHLGTPQVLTDATGAIAWEAHYRPFGDAITSGSLTFSLRFPGQYHDAETGLHYNWHRYYDPQTGRYLTSDPIGLVGGLNPYAYAHGNPIANTDPTGLAVEAAWDIANIALGISQTVSDIRDGDYRAALVSGGATGVDILAAAVPFIPGGASSTLKAARCASDISESSSAVRRYEVGTFDDLVRRSARGDKLDIHHVAQKHPADQIIEGYDPRTAPSIAVPQREHRRIPTVKGNFNGSARDLLAKDARDLRNHTGAYNADIQRLKQLNKKMYPDAFAK